MSGSASFAHKLGLGFDFNLQLEILRLFVHRRLRFGRFLSRFLLDEHIFCVELGGRRYTMRIEFLLHVGKFREHLLFVGSLSR